MAPISELRGGIPWGIMRGLDPLIVVPLCIVFNILVFFPIVWLMDLTYDKYLSRWGLFNRYLDKARKRTTRLFNKYGHFGLALFIGIPLPWTGVYSGTLVGWVMDLDRRKLLLAMILGVIMAATIVTLASYGLIAGASTFMRLLN